MFYRQLGEKDLDDKTNGKQDEEDESNPITETLWVEKNKWIDPWGIIGL